MRYHGAIIVCIILFLFTSNIRTQTAENVIKKYVEAIGGKAAIESINTVIMKRSRYNHNTGEKSYTEQVFVVLTDRGRTRGQELLLSHQEMMTAVLKRQAERQALFNQKHSP